jgi:acetyl esterase/lipase
MALSLDPEIAQALAPMAGAMADATPPAVGDIAARRAMWEPIIGAAGTAQPVPADVKTSEHFAIADDGAQITLRWYTKDGAAPGPAVLFFHGGGYIFGHIDLFDGPVSRYVSASGVPMLSVEYRRAPEHPFPTPLEDAYTALRWLYEHAAELGVDPDRIGVMGDSAGGGMAAGLTILARERGGPTIARQILIMPMLDDRTITPDPHIAPYLLWSYDDSRTAWPALLGEAAGARRPGHGSPGPAPGRDRPAVGLHRGRPARRLPRRGHRLRHHTQPRRRAGRIPPAPRRPARVRLHRFHLRRRPPRHRRPHPRPQIHLSRRRARSPRTSAGVYKPVTPAAPAHRSVPPRWDPPDTGKITLKHRAAGPDSHFAPHAHLRPGDCRTP